MFSKNIFQDLSTLIFRDNGYLPPLETQQKEKIRAFLNRPTTDTAKDLYEFISKVHKKQFVVDLVDNLHLHESNLKNILPNHRDHYIHSVNVYLIGLAIVNSSRYFAEKLLSQTITTSFLLSRETFHFRWVLAACLHDIAYPLELGLKTFNKFTKYFEGTSNSDKANFLRVEPEIYNQLKILPKLPTGDSERGPIRDTALGLIAQHLVNSYNGQCCLEFATLHSGLEDYFFGNLIRGRVDHGIFSAFITLKKIHELYKENGWDPDWYYDGVVDSSTAIFLHNSYKYSFLKDVFGEGKFKAGLPSPLGFLLFISDTLSEWMRGEMEDSHLYGICKQDDKIFFKAAKRTFQSIKTTLKILEPEVPLEIVPKWRI